ncbi:MAG: T9SS type A sorting domain-containing protein [Saprospiraceae bacterium]
MNLKLVLILFGALLSCSSLISAPNNLSISYDGFTTFCGGEISEPQCTGQVNIKPDASGGCSGTVFFWKIDLNTQSFQDSDLSGGGSLDQRLPLGNHIVRYSGRDICGNQAELDIKIEVIDCTPPVPVCYNGLSIDLMPSGRIEVWATDFDANSNDNCYNLDYRLNLVKDENGDGVIGSEDYRTTPPSQDFVTIYCENLGYNYLQMWVKEVSTDRFNNWSYCVTQLNVEDSYFPCNLADNHMFGTIRNMQSNPVKDVEIIVDGYLKAITKNDGHYIFENSYFDRYHIIKPEKNGNVNVGISIDDLSIIAKHILGTQPITEPLKMLAADVNQSQSISALDLMYLKKVMLGLETKFPNDKNWIFLPKHYTFPTPEYPWNYPTEFKISEYLSSFRIDFTGIKLGDVTGDANFKQPDKSLEPRSGFQYALPEMDLEKDMEYSIPVRSLNTIEAVQAAIQLNPEVELLSVENGSIDFETSMVFDEASNTLKFIGVGELIEEGEILFTLHLKTRQSGNTKDLIRLSKEELESKVLLAGGETVNGELYFQKDSNSGIKATASPNPFSDQLNIRFEIKNSSSLDFRITDIQGKEIYASYASYESGLHEIVVPVSLFPRAGIYYYQFKSEDVFQVGKLIHLK